MNKTVLIVHSKDRFLIHKRNNTGLLANLFEFVNIDDASKEVFMRRYIEVYKDCELVKEDEDLQCSRLTCQEVSELYLSVYYNLYFHNRKVGDKFYLEIKGEQTRSGKDELILVGEVIESAEEMEVTKENEDYIVFDNDNVAHAVNGEYILKN